VLTIYGVYRSRAAWNIWMMLESGLNFRHVPIVPAYRIKDLHAPDAPPHSMSAEFLKINANGKVPAVVDGELVLHQSLAINLYLAKKYGGPLAARNLGEEARILMWTHWAATDVEPRAVDILHHRLTYPAEKRQEEVADASVVALRAPFAVLEKELAGRDWLIGDRFTVADLNVAAVINLAAAAPELFDAAPRVRDWLSRCHARPAYQELVRQRDAQPEWTK
jgi:glutathione S-transferase